MKLDFPLDLESHKRKVFALENSAFFILMITIVQIAYELVDYHPIYEKIGIVVLCILMLILIQKEKSIHETFDNLIKKSKK
jgi:low affinity Fe/Cu permease